MARIYPSFDFVPEQAMMGDSPLDGDLVPPPTLRPAAPASVASLPMPHPTKAKKLSVKEKQKYRHARAAHYKEFPDYAKKFNRPPRALLSTAWAILKPHLPKKVVIKRKKIDLVLTREEKLALVVLVDFFLQGGRKATFNDIFDETCRKFSDHFVCSPARRSRDMRPETVRSARRDLLCNDIKINKLYAIYLTITAPRAEELTAKARDDGNSDRVFVLPPDSCKAFLACTRDQGEYFSSRNQPVRLWLDEDEDTMTGKRSVLSQEYCAETPYNRVVIGEKSQQILKLQADARLFFDTDAFNHDYRNAEALKEALHKEFVENYKFDPETPSWKRRSFRIVGLKDEQAPADKAGNRLWARTETWSERAMFVYYASIMRGLGADLDDAAIIAKFERRKARRKDGEFEQRHDDFVVWLVRTARSPAMVVGPAGKTQWKEAASKLIAKYYSSILGQYEKKL